jgi:hypothetical protein
MIIRRLQIFPNDASRAGSTAGRETPGAPATAEPAPPPTKKVKFSRASPPPLCAGCIRSDSSPVATTYVLAEAVKPSDTAQITRTEFVDQFRQAEQDS